MVHIAVSILPKLSAKLRASCEIVINIRFSHERSVRESFFHPIILFTRNALHCFRCALLPKHEYDRAPQKETPYNSARETVRVSRCETEMWKTKQMIREAIPEWVFRAVFFTSHHLDYCHFVSGERATHADGCVFCINIHRKGKKAFQEQFLSGSGWCVFRIRLGWTDENNENGQHKRREKLINWIFSSTIVKRNRIYEERQRSEFFRTKRPGDRVFEFSVDNIFRVKVQRQKKNEPKNIKWS